MSATYKNCVIRQKKTGDFIMGFMRLPYALQVMTAKMLNVKELMKWRRVSKCFRDAFYQIETIDLDKKRSRSLTAYDRKIIKFLSNGRRFPKVHRVYLVLENEMLRNMAVFTEAQLPKLRDLTLYFQCRELCDPACHMRLEVLELNGAYPMEINRCIERFPALRQLKLTDGNKKVEETMFDFAKLTELPLLTTLVIQEGDSRHSIDDMYCNFEFLPATTLKSFEIVLEGRKTHDSSPTEQVRLTELISRLEFDFAPTTLAFSVTRRKRPVKSDEQVPATDSEDEESLLGDYTPDAGALLFSDSSDVDSSSQDSSYYSDDIYRRLFGDSSDESDS